MLSIKYPIYIVSKGRPQTTKTANIFLKNGVDFKIVVEPQEYDEYCKSIPRQFVEKLPFSNLGLGSFPARNWCWENSLMNGFSHHHLFDDNIQSFARLNLGKRQYNYNPIEAIHFLERFTHRFSNVAISGFNYAGFVTKTTKKPFTINTHVYSGMMIRNDIPFRWRLKYNEDVDLTLQALHAGWCTILLNAYLIDKTSTVVKMKGGNQDELYKNNNERKKALKSYSLQQVWPQYVKVVYRFGRPHHQVSWNKFFKQPLKRVIKDGETTEKDRCRTTN